MFLSYWSQWNLVQWVLRNTSTPVNNKLIIQQDICQKKKKKSDWLFVTYITVYVLKSTRGKWSQATRGGGYKFEEWNSRQQAVYTKLCIDLIQKWMKEPLIALCSQWWGRHSCVCSIPHGTTTTPTTTTTTTTTTTVLLLLLLLLLVPLLRSSLRSSLYD